MEKDIVLEAMEEYRKNTPPDKKKKDLEQLERECVTEVIPIP